jgi:hypothetical protein
MKKISKLEDLVASTDQKDSSQPAGYEAPTIKVLDEAQLLEFLGPAQAYSGVLPGTGGGGL